MHLDIKMTDKIQVQETAYNYTACRNSLMIYFNECLIIHLYSTVHLTKISIQRLDEYIMGTSCFKLTLMWQRNVLTYQCVWLAFIVGCGWSLPLRLSSCREKHWDSV